MSTEDVIVDLPKFKFEAKYELKDLIEMGLRKAFTILLISPKWMKEKLLK